MPFQPINFAGIAPIGLPGVAGMPEQIAKGFELTQLPEKARAQIFANQLAKLKADEEPERFRMAQALMGAQAGSAQASAKERMNKIRMLQEYLSGGSGGQGGGAGAGGLQDAMMRHYLGLPAETPQEKSEREIDVSRRKKEMESQYLTAPARTEHEEVISRAPQFIRGLQQLIDAPSPADIHIPFTGIRYRPATYKQHESLAQDLGETFARLRGYPKGQAGQEKAISQLERGTLETDDSYRKRLKKLFPEIAKTVMESSQALGKPVPEWVIKILSETGGNNTEKKSLGSMNKDELMKIAYGG